NSHASANEATITQEGTGQQARINQGVAVQNIDGASASGNLADVEQLGDLNDARINQGIDGASATGGQAYVYQLGTNNATLITQSGSDNYADVRQGNGALGTSVAFNAEATITQTGTNGTVWVEQDRDNAGYVDGSISNVTQAGDDNVVYTLQGAGGVDLGSTANVTQAAGTSNNTAYTFQGHGFSNTSANNLATISQNSGDDNFAQIAQGAEYQSGNNIVSKDNVAKIEQDGDGNEARLDQGVDIAGGTDGALIMGNTGLIVQDGDGNDARLRQ